MKNIIIKKIAIVSLAFTGILFASVSCSKDDVFTGSPIGTNLNFVTFRGTINTLETDVVASQSFPVTITLGDNPDTPEVDLLTFPVDVSVEAIAFLPNLNKRARKSFVIPAGQNSIESTMTAPSGDATTTIPFDFDMQLYLSAITTAQSVAPRGFNGKQYTIVSDTLTLGFGDTSLGGANSKRCAIRFDFDGPYNGLTSGGFNNLDLVFKKNGTLYKVASSASTTRPIYGTTVNNARYETINFLDQAQEYKLVNTSIADSIAGVYTIKSPSGTGANDKPHGFKVGDEVKLETIDGSSLNPLVAQVTSVADAYTCTFNYTGSHLFGNAVAFYQPKSIVRTEIWSPFLAYVGNESTVYNSVTYYCIKNVAANLVGNLYPNADPFSWTTVKPKITWATAFSSPSTWVAGSTGSPQTYNVNDVFKYNNVVYVCIKQHTITSGGTTPNNDTSRWTTAIVEYKSDVLNYTSTDTFTIDTFAKTLATTPSNLRYKVAIRFPDGTSKVYAGAFSGLTVQPAANAIPKLSIVKTTVQGASTYQITNL